MARYIDPTGTKFWSIERTKATIVRTSGKLGSKGRAQSRDFASALHARFHARSFTGTKTHAEKYRPESPRAERPLDDFPFDDDARLVHADALQAKGDPLGELIVLQHAHAQTEDFQASQKLLREIEALVDANADRWFGDLWTVRELFDVDWRLGRLRRVRLGPSDRAQWNFHIARLMPDVPNVYLLSTMLEALFDLDIARSLEELELATAGTLDMQDTIDQLVKLAPPTLRRLELARGPGGNSSFEFGAFIYPLRFPSLEDFRCELDLSDRSLAHIASADWPRLSSLSFGIHGYEGGEPVVVGLTELEPLFRDPGGLRFLEIKTPAPSFLVHAIIDGRGLAKIDELVIRSKRALEPAVEAALKAFNPNARFEQMPMYSMRR